METIATIGTCDRHDCPAPAPDELLIYGQDFHFCRHHAMELLASGVCCDDETSPGAATLVTTS